MKPLIYLNDAATTEIYTLALHDALPISAVKEHDRRPRPAHVVRAPLRRASFDRLWRRPRRRDRKSTRLNSSHANISYAVFCLTKKNTTKLPSLHSPVFRVPIESKNKRPH